MIPREFWVDAMTEMAARHTLCLCGRSHMVPHVYQAGPACVHCGLHPYDGHGGDCPYKEAS